MVISRQEQFQRSNSLIFETLISYSNDLLSSWRSSFHANFTHWRLLYAIIYFRRQERLRDLASCFDSVGFVRLYQ